MFSCFLLAFLITNKHDVTLEQNKINWKGIWNGLKKVVNFLSKLFDLIEESFEENEDGELYFNGYKVVDMKFGDSDEPEEIVLENDLGIKICIMPKIVDFGNIEELPDNKWNWSKIWNIVKKVILFVADLIQSNNLTLSEEDSGDVVSLGDYTLTDVNVDELGAPHGFTLENAAGNSIQIIIMM
ncbi:hypothetical protein GPJ56_006055 [Histomonas meleagridis]|uniref:uncharacterized protein n=1 Tax=Histomonas meleagridis TaxID=135588 RepID=UPI00355A0FD2|nr:hypothetical protein GPJ56_006055 [Histomonas meleagridis]KAH0807163.1 hypothetical protein GO595_000339 [Histomonas meleagridis]